LDKKIIFIAAACHAAIAAYCMSIGDTSHKPWAETPEELKAGTIAGVKLRLERPDTTPEQLHESWLADKLAKGWKFGPIKDVQAKEHPAMVPYAELPDAQRSKDYIFSAVVGALAGLPDAVFEDKPAAVASVNQQGVTVAAAAEGQLPVKYVGKRQHYRDGMYGSGLTFTRDQVRLVPVNLAKKLLQHADVYVLGNWPAATSTGFSPSAKLADAQKPVVDEAEAEAKKKAQQAEEDRIEDTHRALSTMNRKQLANFARVNFNQEIDPDAEDVGAMRDRVKRLVNQLGLPG
jgi:hypothetical protein